MHRYATIALTLACCSCIWSARPATTSVEVVDDQPENTSRVGYFFFNQCGNAAELSAFAQRRGADFIVIHHFLGSSSICNVALFASDSPQ